MRKKIILLSIQIAVVFLALIMTVGTYAWYVAQNSVTVAPTTVFSATTSHAEILREEDVEAEFYMGEEGNGYDFDEDTKLDVPYVVQKKYTIAFTPISEGYFLSAEILSVTIDPAEGVADKLDSSSDPSIIDNFTFRMEITSIDGEPVDEPKTYAPDENGFLYAVIPSSDPATEDTKEYFPIDTDMTLEITFSLIYQSEENYSLLQENRAAALASGRENPVTGKTEYHYERGEKFAYCALEYMRAKFTFNFELGIAKKEAA